MSPLNRKLLRDLWRLKGQALAIAAVIGCGVATVVLAFGTLRSLQETRDAYYARYAFAHVFASLKRAPNYLAADIADIPGVARVQTRILKDVILDIDGMSEPALARLVSISENGNTGLNRLALRMGRWIRPGWPDEVIISENLATAHGFHAGDRFAAIINGKKRTLNIVGIALSPEYVYAVGPGQLVPDDRTFGIIWMGRKALEAAFDLQGAFNAVSVTLRRGALEDEVIDRLDARLERYGGVGAYGRKDQISDVFLSSEMGELENMGHIIPPIFLGVAAFLLHIVVSRLIDTEREQIGLLKAFGYTHWEVGWHYVKFVLVLTVVGILLGLVVGVWMGRGLTSLYTAFFRFPFLYYRLNPAIFAAAALVALLATLGGTYFAVRRSVRLQPAVAMRPAPPVVYRRSFLERIGFASHISEPSRMIWRHIWRWPLRSGLACLGMAFSVALLIVSLFPLPAIEQAIESYYFQSQRQDATVAFIGPKNKTALYGIEAMPGVMVAESFRQVPAILSKGHREQRLSIIGVSPGSDINRLLDIDLNPIPVPPEGVVLSQYLANLLQARVGERVRVEAMTGKRPVEDLIVSAIVQEYIGLSAYMSTEALHRFMQEGPVVSGVHIMMDQARAGPLYARLKETPVVTAITLKSTALRSFRETLAETMSISLSFYIAFGALIAFGVVYNAARISLSERARELASLRVLGFTRAEVSYILLGELGVLLLVAMPIGCVLGYGLAWTLAMGFQTDMFRVPLVVERGIYARAIGVVLLSGVVSGLIVLRRLNRLDIVSVLKTRD